MGNWVGISPKAVLPSALQDAASAATTATTALGTFTDTAVELLSLRGKIATYINDPKVVAVKAGITAARATLDAAMSPSGAIHLLTVPPVGITGRPYVDYAPLSVQPLVNAWQAAATGSGGNLGFYNTIQSSLFDVGDTHRPIYASDKTMTCLVVLAGAKSYAEVMPAFGAMQSLLGTYAPALPAATLSAPRDVKVRLVQKGAIINWRYSGDSSAPDFGISRSELVTVYIYRGTKPFTGMATTTELAEYQIAALPAATVQALPFYIDTTITPGETYYYAVGFQFALTDANTGARKVCPQVMASNPVVFDTVRPRVVGVPPVSSGVAPDWDVLGSVRELTPALSRAFLTAQQLLTSLETVVATAPNPYHAAAEALAVAAQQRLAAVTRLNSQVTKLLASLQPATGLYGVAFSGKGGTDFVLSSLASALNAPDAPPFHTGTEIVGGAVLVAGDDTPTVRAVQMLSSLLGL